MIKKILALGAIVGMTAGIANASDKIDVNICGGSEGGTYISVAHDIAKSIQRQDRKGLLNVAVLETEGSYDNIDLMNEDECNIAILQGDVSAYAHATGKLSKDFKSYTAHTETIIYMANTKNGYTDLEKIEGKEDVYLVVANNSGSLGTLQNFANEDDGYKVNLESAIFADDAYDAAMIASTGTYNGKKVAGALLVTRPHTSSLIGELSEDFGATLTVGAMSDGDFDDAKDNNGEKLYFDVKFPSARYAFEKHETFGDQSTLAVNAVAEFNPDFGISDRKQARKVSKIVKKGIAKAMSQWRGQ